MSHLIPLKHEHRLLSVMLITLHFLLWWGFIDPFLSRLLFLFHLGGFLLWQPLWGNQQGSLTFRHLVVISIVMLSFLIFLNTWIIILWEITLIGVLGGRDLSKPIDKFANLLAIIYLAVELFMISLHEAFVFRVVHLDGIGIELFKYGLFSFPLILMFISTENSPENRYHIDLSHSLTFALLITLLGSGSLVLMFHTNLTYPLAVFRMTLATTLFILTVSWLWIVFAGEEGSEPLWTRHLMNIHSSFEQWLDNLAQPNNYKNLTPQEFLHAGFAQLSTLPWVAGMAWQSLYGNDMLGKKEKYHLELSIQTLEVTVYSYYRITGGHDFQIKILIQLLEYFHQAKRREAAFAQQARLQAIYEAGAKLTHDIKNLLQSLHAITSVIETYPPNQFGDTQRLLQGQMPHLTQRLKRTLDKLQKPAEFSYSHIPVNLWWGNLKARYRKSQIDFFSQTTTDTMLIPEDLFDNVSENLIQNALMKRKREPHLHIEVSLRIDEKHNIQLTVCDDGSSIPDEIYKSLFKKPVTSRDGFGIGLYQAVKQLANTGYDLNTMANETGHVCFELTNVKNAD